MENPTTCPACHVEVRPTDYFCYNCGKNLNPAPPSTSLSQQIVVYLESLLLPPYGIIIGIRYLKVEDSKSKIIGWVSIILTIVSIIILIVATLDLIKTINTQLNTQLNNMGY
jgi:uncharacterized membrane protein YvbJ